MPQAILKPQIPAAIFSSRHRRMMRERETVYVGRRPQNQHRATTAAKGNNTRDEAHDDRRAKKKSLSGEKEKKKRARAGSSHPCPSPVSFSG